MSKPIKSRLCQWTAALESGKFKKTRGVLRKKIKGEYRFCAIGVACKIYADATGATDAFGSNDDFPLEVKAWYGLQNERGNIRLENGYSISDMNDIMGADFNRIAKEIKETYDLKCGSKS